VDRLACLDVPALPLQLLVRRNPGWTGLPVAVVAEERPSGLVLWVNEPARAARVLPGLRYAAALGLCPELRAGTVSDAAIRQGVAELAELLHRFSPEIEPSASEPGILWLDASGLLNLFRSLEAWASLIREALAGAGFEARIAVGFTRFGTYALARQGSGLRVLASPEEERQAARETPLERLGVEPALRNALEQLAVRTLGAFLELPAEGVLKRFGFEAYWLHALASEELLVPLQPLGPAEPLKRTLELDPPETDRTRLIFFVKRLLHPLLRVLASRGEALAELALHLGLEGALPRVERLRPAAPTLDALLVLELVPLRLEGLELASGVAELGVEARGLAVRPEQLRLFDEPPRRDPAAAARALARLRAEFGERCVVRAVLQEGHLPEAGFRWEPLDRLAPARPRQVERRPLVRRLHAPARPLPRTSAEPGGGPFIVSGGWWVREVHREYYFIETRDGAILWVYFDRRRRRWFLHAEID
jgi:protein ImuB